jgi:hypothetical protein
LIVFEAPARRGEGNGKVKESFEFAEFNLKWKEEGFTAIVVQVCGSVTRSTILIISVSVE